MQLSKNKLKLTVTVGVYSKYYGSIITHMRCRVGQTVAVGGGLIMGESTPALRIDLPWLSGRGVCVAVQILVTCGPPSYSQYGLVHHHIHSVAWLQSNVS